MEVALNRAKIKEGTPSFSDRKASVSGRRNMASDMTSRTREGRSVPRQRHGHFYQPEILDKKA